jgi:dihydroxyacid dehydratase/phosphogluconate dehydratase
MQMGYGREDYAGKPVIAIVNAWSDAQQCHAHFKTRVSRTSSAARCRPAAFRSSCPPSA